MSYDAPAPMGQSTATRAPWLAWPNGATWRAFLLNAILIQVLWIVVYGGASWITSLHTYRVPLGLAWESRIPFIPATSVIYLSLGPMMWLSPFILQSAAELRAFAKSLAWLIVVSGVGFLLLPGEAPRVPSTIPSFGSHVFSFADWINLDYNCLPSLHVGMAVLCAYAFGKRLSLAGAALFYTWAAAISISTLLTHQHYLADVIAGALVGYVVAWRTLRIDWSEN